MDSAVATNKRQRPWHDVVVVLMGGAVGVIGALLGAWLQIDATEQAQQASFAEERRREDRERRERAYFDFMSAADTYADSAGRYARCYGAWKFDPNKDTSVGPQCDQLIKPMERDRKRFQAAHDAIDVYASTRVIKLANLVAKELPIAFAPIPRRSPDPQLITFNDFTFSQAYGHFRAGARSDLCGEGC